MDEFTDIRKNTVIGDPRFAREHALLRAGYVRTEDPSRWVHPDEPGVTYTTAEAYERISGTTTPTPSG